MQFLKLLLEMILQQTTPPGAIRPLPSAQSDPVVFQGRYFSKLVPRVFREKILSATHFQQRAFEIRTGHVCRLYIIVCPGQSRPAAFFKEAAQKVYHWLTLCSQFAPPECSRNLDVYLYLLQDKKVLPCRKHQHLDVQHVNSAFTRRGCDEFSEINIFREEEWFKVLIHETFHNHGLDFSLHFDAYDALVQQELRRCFPALHSNVLLFESYCEFWAETLHTLFLAAAAAAAGSAEKGSAWKKAQQLFLQERQFAALQCVKVLDHYGLRYADLLLPSPSSAAAGFTEDRSNVFAYHVIKFLMVEADYLSWHVAVVGPTLRFSDDYVMGFCKWIYKNRRVPNLLHMERLYAAMDRKEPLAQTLRMVANG
jgi:hypothetical protein